jgi:hypothetical protein
MKLRSFSAVLATAAILWAGAAAADPPAYNVVKSDVTIPFGSRINQVDRPERQTLLVRTGANRWYRVQMSEACARSSMIGAPVSFQTTGMGGPIDTLSYVRLEDRSCAVQSIDRVELIASAE